MTGALVCHWCDGTEHRRSPLLWDRAREAFVHGRCARPDADLRSLARVHLDNGHTISGGAIIDIAVQRPKVARIDLGRAVARKEPTP